MIIIFTALFTCSLLLGWVLRGQVEARRQAELAASLKAHSDELRRVLDKANTSISANDVRSKTEGKTP